MAKQKMSFKKRCERRLKNEVAKLRSELQQVMTPRKVVVPTQIRPDRHYNCPGSHVYWLSPREPIPGSWAHLKRFSR